MKEMTRRIVKADKKRQLTRKRLRKQLIFASTFVTASAAAIQLTHKQTVQATSIGTTGLSQAQFIAQIAQYARPIAESNDLYTSVMMAQAIVESNWGQSALAQAPNYNLFGIKGSYNGQTVYMNTQEYLNNQWVTKKEPFKRYPSYRESFLDNAATLKGVSFSPGTYYYAGAFKSNTTSYRDATAWLTGRYATAPHYAQALNQIIETYQLTQYDSTGQTTPVDYEPTPQAPSQTPSTYTVVSGDYLSKIANQFGISVAQLKTWNNLSSDLILVGQKLAVTAPTNQGTASSQTPSGSSVTNTDTYTVISGDYLSKIAARFGISVAQLKTWNNLSSDLILVGQKLTVKASSDQTTQNTTIPSQPTSTTTSNQTASSYTVVSGDYLSKIANQFGVSVAQLKTWNNLSSDLILIGQKLTVKASSDQTTQNTTTSNTTTSSQTYKVVSGDNLWTIAQRNNLSLQTLKQMNQLTSDTIFIGQVLKLK